MGGTWLGTEMGSVSPGSRDMAGAQIDVRTESVSPVGERWVAPR